MTNALVAVDEGVIQHDGKGKGCGLVDENKADATDRAVRAPRA